MSNNECSQKIYKYGTQVAVLDVSKEDAEEFCQKKTQETGVPHDWHYFAGRVIVKALYPTELLEVMAQRDDLLAMAYELLPYVEEADCAIYKKGVIPNLVSKIKKLIAKCEKP